MPCRASRKSHFPGGKAHFGEATIITHWKSVVGGAILLFLISFGLTSLMISSALADGGADAVGHAEVAAAGNTGGSGPSTPSIIGAPGGTGNSGTLELIGATSVPSSAGPGLTGIAAASASDAGDKGGSSKFLRP